MGYNEKTFIEDFKEYVTRLEVASVLEVGAMSGELMDAVGGVGISLETIRDDVVKADIRQYHGKKYELVFSSGVLEHYVEEEAIKFLQAKAKASSRYVLTYVPNTNCVAYMMTKKHRSDSWPQEWREELDFTPETLATIHEKAGLKVLDKGVAAKEWAKLFGPEPSEGYLSYVLAEMSTEKKEEPKIKDKTEQKSSPVKKVTKKAVKRGHKL